MAQLPSTANSLCLIPGHHTMCPNGAPPACLPAPPMAFDFLSFWATSMHPDAQRQTVDLNTCNIFKLYETYILLHSTEEKLEAQKKGQDWVCGAESCTVWGTFFKNEMHQFKGDTQAGLRMVCAGSCRALKLTLRLHSLQGNPSGRDGQICVWSAKAPVPAHSCSGSHSW